MLVKVIERIEKEGSTMQNQHSKGKIKNWISEHSAGIALAVALWGLFRTIGLIDMFFNFFASPKELHDSFTSTALSFVLPDIFSLLLSGAAIVIGWKTMKHYGGFWQRGKGGFVVGVICLVISFTSIGDACTVVTTAIPIWAKTTYYGLTGQIDKMNEYEGVFDGGITVTLQQEDCEIDAHIDSTENPAYGTKMKVVGTITNNTEETWNSATLSFVLVDANGEPKKVESYDEVPVLEASVGMLNPGETAKFESRVYPGILESDYDGITDCKIVEASYFQSFDEE